MNRKWLVGTVAASLLCGGAWAKPAAKAPKTDTSPTPHVRISARHAARTAKRKYHGKVVGKVALENEGGQWEYAVNLRSGKVTWEVMVDANTGKITSVEQTTANEKSNGAGSERTAGEKG